MSARKARASDWGISNCDSSAAQERMKEAPKIASPGESASHPGPRWMPNIRITACWPTIANAKTNHKIFLTTPTISSLYWNIPLLGDPTGKAVSLQG
ncbi:MAG: hypothetical protein A2Z34_06925 [Planctomycetes bacterium RBG_16_59_8]|nr:MAG: hypothetical protein A2Z34_06925 [Planctomycetes bacterium RBG_16_59_8]